MAQVMRSDTARQEGERGERNLREQKKRFHKHVHSHHAEAPFVDAAAVERKIVSSMDMLQHMKHLFSGSAASSAPRTAQASIGRSVKNGGTPPPPPQTESDAESERAAILMDIVKNLRRECTAWTKELLYAYPVGTFDGFFASPVNPASGSDALLPPPPPEDAMLTAYHAAMDAKDQTSAAQATRSGVNATIQELHQQSRWHLGQHVVAAMASGCGGAPTTSAAHVDPVRVLGLQSMPNGGERTQPPDVRLVQQTVHEAHALSLLMHVMHTAAALDQQGRDGSRGSSETPSVTTIASVNDQHVSDGHLGTMRQGGGPLAQASAGTSLLRPVSMVSAASSAFSPDAKRLQHLSPAVKALAPHRSIQFQDTHDGYKPTLAPLAAATTSSSSHTESGNRTSGSTNRTSDSTTSATVHDTSTAATAGGSKGSVTGAAQPPRANVWGREASNSTEAAQEASTSRTSTSSRKKKKKGLFSCVRRAESDDSD